MHTQHTTMHTHACIHTHIHTNTCVHIHSRTHACIYMYNPTNAYTHTDLKTFFGGVVFSYQGTELTEMSSALHWGCRQCHASPWAEAQSWRRALPGGSVLGAAGFQPSTAPGWNAGAVSAHEVLLPGQHTFSPAPLLPLSGGLGEQAGWTSTGINPLVSYILGSKRARSAPANRDL